MMALAYNDTFVRSSEVSTSFGNATLIEADTDPAIEHGLVRFNLTSLPQGATLTSAKLRLYVADSSTHAFDVHHVDSNWDEATTWSTRPLQGVKISTLSSAATVGTWAEANITSAVTGNGWHDFYIIPTGIEGAGFNSSEATSYQPQLQITYTSFEKRLNCGGGDLTDSEGKLWESDATYATGGTAYTRPTSAGYPSTSIHATERYGTAFRYEIPVPADVTNVTVDYVMSEAYPHTMYAGERIFSSKVEGVDSLVDVDVYEWAGAKTQLVLQRQHSVTDGAVTIEFSSSIQAAMLSGLVVHTNPAAPDPAKVYPFERRINVGGNALSQYDGHAWNADEYFSGGTAYTRPTSAGYPATSLHATERYGSSFQYNIPLPAGVSQVTVNYILSEAYSGAMSPGARVFSSTVEGTQASLTNVDVYNWVGALTELVLQRQHTVTDGVLSIQFTSSAQNAMISGFIIRQGHVAAADPAMPPPSSTCNGVDVYPDTDPNTNEIQQALNANNTAGGNTFCIRAGTYRLRTEITPSTGDKLIGDGIGKTILNGAKRITTWIADPAMSGRYYAQDYLPGAYTQPDTNWDECETISPTPCHKAETVWKDGIQLRREMVLSNLDAGEYFQDYSLNRIYIKQSPGTSSTLWEVNSTEYAVRTLGGVNNVTIDGMTIEKYANRMQRGAIQIGSGTGWVITNNEVRYNGATGIRVYGDNVTIKYNNIHHNGQLGIGGSGVTGVLIEDNVITNNNTLEYWINDFEAGGIKFTEVYPSNGQAYNGVIVKNNDILNNKGVGLWCDINCQGATFESNTINGNGADGIRFELSADARIRYNVLKYNARNRGARGGMNESVSVAFGAAITSHNSHNVEIAHNDILGMTDTDANANGIVLQMRGSRSGYTTNNNVHDNYIEQHMGRTGLYMQGLTLDASLPYYDYNQKRNRFYSNDYHTRATLSTPFFWLNSTAQSLNTSINQSTWQQTTSVGGKYYWKQDTAASGSVFTTF